MLEMIGVIVGVIAGIAGIVGAIVGVLQYLHHRQTTARREAEETAARREAEEEPQPLPQPEWMEQIYLEGKELMGQPNPPGVVGVGNDVLKDDDKTPAGANRRRLGAVLREAEKTAAGLLMELQRSLEEYPDRHRFRVLQGSAVRVLDSSSALVIDYHHDGDGDLGGWVARQAADGLLFQLVPDKSSPPVYEMSEELVRHLNGRGH